MTQYDSRHATIEHISHVRTFLFKILAVIQKRAADHDQSMFQVEEKDCLDKYVPILQSAQPRSDEHKKALSNLQTAFENHRKNNPHHIEHYGDLKGMDLIDLIEWLCDQKAASLQEKSNDLEKRLLFYYQKYNFPDEMKEIVNNTVKRYFQMA